MLEFYVDSLITIHFFNYHGGVIISDLMINGQIRDKEVRLIANDGEQLGVMSAREAQKLADEAGLDLVKISPKQNHRFVRLSITVSTNTSRQEKKSWQRRNRKSSM